MAISVQSHERLTLSVADVAVACLPDKTTLRPLAEHDVEVNRLEVQLAQLDQETARIVS